MAEQKNSLTKLKLPCDNSTEGKIIIDIRTKRGLQSHAIDFENGKLILTFKCGGLCGIDEERKVK